jgi:transposase
MGRKRELRQDLHTAAVLRRLARSERTPRTARRMLGLANIMDGMGVAEAAIAVGMERQSLGDAVKRYNEEGLDGLYDRVKPGRPRKLDAAQEAELARLVLAGPDPETDGISAFTLEDLARIAQERWQAVYHPWSMSRVLKRLGFSRQKARPHHPKKDEAAQAAFKGAP